MGVQTRIRAASGTTQNRTVHSAKLLFTEHKINLLREKALEQIASLVVWREDGTALVRAGEAIDNPQYANAWGRDILRVILGLQALPHGFHSPNVDLRPGQKVTVEELVNSLWLGFFSVIAKYEAQVMDVVIAKPSSYGDDSCMPPRVVPETLERVPGQWSNRQEPNWFGEGLIYAPHFIRKERVESPLAVVHARLYEKMAKYLLAIDCFLGSFSNAWEEPAADVYTSNIGAALGGLKAAARTGVEVPPTKIRLGQALLDDRLSPEPKETDSRKSDLALLWLGRYGVVSDSKMAQIVDQVITDLGTVNGVPRIMGFARHQFDDYQGLDGLPHANRHSATATNSEWLKGFAELAMYFAHVEGREAQAQFANYLAKTVGVFDTYGKPFEQFVPVHSNGKTEYGPSNVAFIPRTPLAWTAASILQVLK